MDGQTQGLERAGDIHGVKVVIKTEEDLEFWETVAVLLNDCTHCDGI